MNLFGLTANIIDACFLIFGKTGKFLNKPKPKQPQSKFIDANPNDTPSNPFNESD